MVGVRRAQIRAVSHASWIRLFGSVIVAMLVLTMGAVVFTPRQATAGDTTSADGRFRFRYIADKTVVTPGTSVTYRYEIANLTSDTRIYALRGGVLATLTDPVCAVTSSAVLSAARGWFVDSGTGDRYVAPGATAWVDCTTTINQTTTSTAGITGLTYSPSGTAPAVSATETVTVTSQADYTVAASATPEIVQPGGLVTWNATVRNTGSVTGGSYTFTATVPSAFTQVRSQDGCAIGNGIITCGSQPGLPAGATRLYTFTALARTNASGVATVDLSVAAASNAGGSETGGSQVTIAAGTSRTSSDGDFTVTKTADRYSVPAGGASVTYTYTVKNNTGGRQFYYSGRDDKCTPVKSQSGLSRVWDYWVRRYFYYIPAGGTATFTCSDYISQTVTNTATFLFADGYARSLFTGPVTYRGTSSATASATVARQMPSGMGDMSCSTLWYSSDERFNRTVSNGAVGVLDVTTGSPTQMFDIGKQTGNPRYGSAALAMNPADPSQIYFIPREGVDTRYRGVGLWVYDRQTDSSRELTSTVPENGTAVARLGADPYGNIWAIAGNGGVWRFDTAWPSEGWRDMGEMRIPTSVAKDANQLQSGDLAFDGNGTMYFITSNINAGRRVSYLLSITYAELTDGSPSAKLAGQMGGSLGLNGLAFTEDGRAYGTESTDLYSVDINTGEPTHVGPIGDIRLIGDLTSCALPKPLLRATKTVTPYGPVARGAELIYTIEIENIGTLDATSVTLQDIPDGARVLSARLNNGAELGATAFNSARPISSPGNLAGIIGPGESATVTLRVAIDPGRLQVCNQSRTTYEGFVGTLLSDDASLPGDEDETCTSVYDPDIGVTKTGSTDVLNSDGTDTEVTYGYDIVNTGNEPLTGITATDDKCAPVTYQHGDTDSNGIIDGDETWRYTCTRVLSGTSRFDNISDASVRNTVTVSGTGTETGTKVTSTDDFLVTPPGLTLRKDSDAGPRPVKGGDVITYTITARNTTAAPIQDLTRVTITDQLPPGVTYVEGSATKTYPTGGATIPAHAPPELVTPSDNVTLQHGEVLTVTFKVRVDVPVSVGSITNTAVGDSVQKGPVEDNVTDRAERPYLDAAKFPGVMTGPDASGDYAVEYTVRVSNAGPGNTVYGPITDTPRFAANLTPTSATWTGHSSGSATLSGPDHTFSIGSANTPLLDGESHTYTVTIVFKPTGSASVPRCSAAGSGTFNTVELPTGQETGSTTNNDACVEPITAFSVQKAAAGGKPGGVGASVSAEYDAANNRFEAEATYTITVTNTGLVAAPQPAMTDTITAPAGFTITQVTVNGADQATSDGSFVIPAGSADLPPGESTVYVVIVTSHATAPKTIDWAFTASCLPVSEEAALAGGIVNAVKATLDSGGPGDDYACVPIVPAAMPITVIKLGQGCDVGEPACRLSGARFELYTADPRAGAAPLEQGFAADAADASLFRSTPLAYGATYWVAEAAAPEGHTLLPAPIRLSVTASGITLGEPAENTRLVRLATDDSHTLEVLDPTPAVLPATGGTGPVRVLVAGALLVVLGALLGTRPARSARPPRV